MQKLSILFLVSWTFLITSCSTTKMNSQEINPTANAPSTVTTASKQPLSDSAITNQINDKFTSEKLFKNNDIASVTIQVKTIDKVVYLVGLADNKAQMEKAVEIAKSVDGVINVDTSQLLIANQ